MKFEYLAEIRKNEQIDIEDVGNTAIDVYNDLGFEWILAIRTRDGFANIVEYGPILHEEDVLPREVCYTYSRIEYHQKKLVGIIDKFLNDSYKGVTQAFEITVDNAKDTINSRRRLSEYL